MQNFNQIPSISFLFLHDLFFSPRHPLESKERFVNLFSDFSPLCGGGWAVRRRQQAIGGQCLIIYLIKCQKRKNKTKMIGFSYYIMQSYMHKCNKTICSLPIVLYIFPPRASVRQDCIGVSINDVLIFLSWKIANSRICIQVFSVGTLIFHNFWVSKEESDWEMVFCYQNCSDLLWEKIVLVIE